MERERRRSKAAVANVEDYLASLAIEIEITPLAQADLPRAAQLTQRTNQFNTTTLRRTEAEMAELIGRNPARVLKVEVRDRFGDYGFVGLATLDWRDGACTVDSLMLSCRVLGRRVEHALLRGIAELAKQAGVRTVSLAFRPSDRNQPARAFLQSIGVGLNDHYLVDFPVDEIEDILAGMSAHPAPAMGEDDTPAAVSGGKIAASAGLGWIAGLKDDGALLEDALAQRTRRRPDLVQPFLAPQNQCTSKSRKSGRLCSGSTAWVSRTTSTNWAAIRCLARPWRPAFRSLASLRILAWASPRGRRSLDWPSSFKAAVAAPR
jgi:hypothetical protein